MSINHKCDNIPLILTEKALVQMENDKLHTKNVLYHELYLHALLKIKAIR